MVEKKTKTSELEKPVFKSFLCNFLALWHCASNSTFLGLSLFSCMYNRNDNKRKSYSSTGEKGSSGPVGFPGLPGLPGIPGADGLKGISGSFGKVGQPGQAGTQGEKGERERKRRGGGGIPK